MNVWAHFIYIVPHMNQNKKSPCPTLFVLFSLAKSSLYTIFWLLLFPWQMFGCIYHILLFACFYILLFCLVTMLKKKPWCPIKTKPEETWGRSCGASHKKQKINLWPEENMEILLKEYNSAHAHKQTKGETSGWEIWNSNFHCMEVCEWDCQRDRHHSGGPSQPKVLSRGKWKLCQVKIVMVKSQPKNNQAKCTCTNQKILFFRGWGQDCWSDYKVSKGWFPTYNG